jgi:5-methylcytosine-specific restriction endonuclease McrA
MDTKTCPKCGKATPISEFMTKNGKAKYPDCLECRRRIAKKRMRERQVFDPKAIRQYLIGCRGGRCEQCGYHQYIEALEFHHYAPQRKSGAIGDLINRFCYGGTPTLFTELCHEVSQCVILCSNCHQAFHQGCFRLSHKLAPGFAVYPFPER